MQELNCPYEGCQKVYGSDKKLNLHLVLDHEAYNTGVPVYQKALQDITKLKDMVKFCLIRFPATRSDDQLLYEKILQWFYPYSVKYVKGSDFPIQPANGIGWTFSQWCHFPTGAVMSRRRREIQLAFPELQANEQTTAERELKEEAEYEHYRNNVLQGDRL